MKRVLRRDTIDQNIVILDFVQAAAHLRSRFCTAGWQEKHGLDTKYVINKVSIIEAHSVNINRRENEVYDPVIGIRKSFGYMALGGGRVLQRWFDCWCPECMKAGGPGQGSMNSNYQVSGCCSHERWYEYSVALQGTRGLVAQRLVAQRKGRELAEKLKPGTFIAVQDRGVTGPNVPFLIGITQDTGNGSCIEQHIGSRQTINSTRFDAGDYAISVKWSGCALKKDHLRLLLCRLERLSEDPEQRTFELAGSGADISVINSTELRLVGVEMDKYKEKPLGVAPRRSQRGSTRASSLAQVQHSVNQTFILPTQIEQFILQACH